ncbi:MAG: hypothetical protein A7315_12085 [Candidatus Altiarchaeales archaeon WOR_SM1_79]|nr:MAG: hypothetical protein A7315_12085 [Candidatus Altiarchaeales archaeon WOR_SM1_79]
MMVENIEIIYEKWEKKNRTVVEVETEVFEKLFDVGGKRPDVVERFFNAYVKVCKDTITNHRFPSQSDVGKEIQKTHNLKTSPKDIIFGSKGIYKQYPAVEKIISRINQPDTETIDLYHLEKYRGWGGKDLEKRPHLVPKAIRFKDKNNVYSDLVFNFENGKVGYPTRKDKKPPAETILQKLKEVNPKYIFLGIIILIFAGLLTHNMFVQLVNQSETYSVAFWIDIWIDEDDYSKYIAMNISNKCNCEIDITLQIPENMKFDSPYIEGRLRSTKKNTFSTFSLSVDKDSYNKVYFTPDTDEVLVNLSIESGDMNISESDINFNIKGDYSFTKSENEINLRLECNELKNTITIFKEKRAE